LEGLGEAEEKGSGLDVEVKAKRREDGHKSCNRPAKHPSPTWQSPQSRNEPTLIEPVALDGSTQESILRCSPKRTHNYPSSHHRTTAPSPRLGTLALQRHTACGCAGSSIHWKGEQSSTRPTVTTPASLRLLVSSTLLVSKHFVGSVNHRYLTGCSPHLLTYG
jgi:hypothetical protein